MIKADEAILFFWMLFMGIAVFMLGVHGVIQNKKINELEIMLQEQQLIDSIGKQLVVSKLNIR